MAVIADVGIVTKRRFRPACSLKTLPASLFLMRSAEYNCEDEPVSDQQLKSVTIQHQRTTDDNIYYMEIFEARWMNKSV